MNTMFRFELAVLALAASLGLASADVPKELKALGDAREREIREVDRIYKRELEKLKADFVAKGDVGSAAKAGALLAGVVENQVLDMCEIELVPNRKIDVLDLKAQAERLSGHYRPVFDAVDPSFKGARFTRVPWQKGLSFKIRATKAGNLYVCGASKISGRSASESDHEVVQGLLKGAYLENFRVHKIKLIAGEAISCEGFECFLIAKEITLKE